MFDIVGPFSRVFNDFGNEFIVLENTGEQTKENQTPTPVLFKFQSFKEWLCSKDNIMLDFNLADADYEKTHNWFVYNLCFSAFDAFIKEHKRIPRPWSFEDADVFAEIESTASTNIGKELN